MKLLLTKTCQGVIDTDCERERIKKAFRNDPETRRRLTLLVEEGLSDVGKQVVERSRQEERMSSVGVCRDAEYG